MNHENEEPINMEKQINEIAEISSFLKENDIFLAERNLTSDELIDQVIGKKSPTGAFYIINLYDIIKKVHLWKELFDGISIRYAVKSNPDLVICELLAQMGVGFDVASENEIKSIKNLVEPSRIIYANPVKQPKSISYARSVDVDLLVVDCENELHKIILYHPHAKILIRVKVDDSDSLCKFSDKFGLDKEEIPVLLSLAKSMSLDIVGVCFHIGSQCTNAEKYYSAIKIVRETFDIAKEIGFKFDTIDIGGGFPGSLDENNMTLLRNISSQVSRGLEDFFGKGTENQEYEPLHLLAEPGRYMVASSHILVVDVIGKKVKKNCPPCSSNTKEITKKITYTINDGLYASFNCMTYDHQKPIIIPYNNRDEKKYPSIVFGNTCDSVDKICSDIELPELEVGDLCYVKDFGAYTRASSSSFNGFNDVKIYYVISQ